MDAIRVLLAEDVALLRKGLRVLLAPFPDIRVEAREAADGLEAVRLAELLLPHVVLMDLWMPGLDGLEATARIRALCPCVRVLVLTGEDGAGRERAAALAAGAAGFLLKSASPGELARAIRQAAQA